MTAAAGGQRSLARLQVLLAAALFSTGGAAIKAVHAGSWTVSTLRSGIAALALVLLLREARRGWSARAALVGIAYAATVMLFVTSTKLTTSANAIFLQSTAPLYILLLSPWLLRERIRRADVLFMLVVGGGLALFFLDGAAPASTAPEPGLGNLLAVASGVTFAFLVMGMRWLSGALPAAGVPDDTHATDAAARAPASARRESGGALACVVLGNALAFGAGLPFMLGSAQPWPPAPGDWALLGFLGVIQIALAYAFLVRGLRHVPAFEASVLLLAEPALNPVWSWLAHGEVPGALALLGGAAILLATLFKSWHASRVAAPG